MPGLNRTGPWSEGPMTGGRRGRCASISISAHRYGRARVPGRGVGRGFRSCYWDSIDYQSPHSPVPFMERDQEIEFLKSQAQSLKAQLDEIEDRLSGLKKEEN